MPMTKSWNKLPAAALVLLAAVIAGLAPRLQAQLDANAANHFLDIVNNVICSDDPAMKNCARQIVDSGGASVPLECCGDLLMPVLSGQGKQCACGFGDVANNVLGIDVDQKCQAASNGKVLGGPPILKEFCMAGPAPAPAPPAALGN